MIAKRIERRSEALSELTREQRLNHDTLVAALFRARGEDAVSGRNYSLQALARPEQLGGIDRAVALLSEALSSRQHICIVGDFDADGATSTALLYRCLNAMGAAKVSYLVPNRFEFGYGLTPEIVALAATHKPNLIVTVDNGISSHEGVRAAHAAGIKVLVTDHHLPGAELPEADAIVNPNVPGCAFPSKHLAGVGVIFYVMLALRSRLREEGWFEAQQREVPNLAEFLDLVALGTVADVVPLDHNNRILVAQGIQRIRAGLCCPGILAILTVAGRSPEKLGAADFGFAIGPRLNAAGRLDDMSIGIRCLLCDDAGEAQLLAQELDGLNRERRAIEHSMQADAVRELERMDTSAAAGRSGVCLYQADWHQGVVGIVASRIKDRLHRPVIAFAEASDTEIKGSGRSIPGIHLRDMLDEVATRHPGLLVKFGGHAMAAGLSIDRTEFERFAQAFDDVVAAHMTEEMRQPVIYSDGALLPDQFTVSLAAAIRDAGPWGQAFPEPVFDGVFRVLEQRLVGEKHLKMLLSPGEFSQVMIDAIAFNVDLALWPDQNVQYIRAAYQLDINEWRGRVSPQLIVSYLEPCRADAQAP